MQLKFRHARRVFDSGIRLQAVQWFGVQPPQWTCLHVFERIVVFRLSHGSLGALGLQSPHAMTEHTAICHRLNFWYDHLWSALKSHTQRFVLGGQSELETAVATMLREHGVFTNRVLDRTKSVLQQLGQQPVTQALRSARPWAALKALANEHTPKIRLIWEDEFSHVVKSRTGKDNKFGTKKKTSRPQQSAVFTPQDVAFPEGVFCQQSGAPLAQIPARNISPNAKGVAVLSEAELQPYSQQNTISKESLAFLVLAPFSQEIQMQGETIRFPAQSTATSEPVLLSAVLIQKGASPVTRLTPKQPVCVDTVPTQTLKILLYRDQAPKGWEEIVDRPVKAILDILPCLRLCKMPDCHCQGWHPTDEDAAEPILDIWQRDWMTQHFKRSKPAEAAIFSCMMRVTAKAFQAVDSQSGTTGLYIEARAHDGRSQDERFHTVWLPKIIL